MTQHDKAPALVERLKVVARCGTDSTMRHSAYAFMAQNPDGDYVTYSAYAALAEENRRLRGALQRIEAVSFQARVAPWMDACFGPAISGDRLERGDRLLEEVLELLQSGEYPRDRIAALTEYVWSRPTGEPAQEIGGVMITLAAYCLAYDFDMHDAGESELARIWTKVEKIRAKQATKPTGSALTQARPDTDLKGSDENDRH